MALLIHTSLLHLVSSSSALRTTSRPSSPFSISSMSSFSAASISALNENWQKSLVEFPYLSPSHSHLMQQLLSSFHSRLGSQLLPSSVSPDIASFCDSSDTSHGSIDFRFGLSDHSPVDFVLASWLHSCLPSGASLDIATIFAFLNASTDAPHLSLEFIRSSPTSLVLLLDFLPRKDLVLHPDYLHAFYNTTHLDSYRQRLDEAMAPATRPYVSSSLYIRSVLSPTAIAVSIESELLEEKLGEVGEVVKEVVELWLERCGKGGERLVDNEEREVLVRRDYLIKTKAVEVDLTSNLPRLFGPEVTGRVVKEVRKAFGIAD